ncbi:unnamed protein product, partial [Urochloa humidicola]
SGGGSGSGGRGGAAAGVGRVAAGFAGLSFRCCRLPTGAEGLDAFADAWTAGGGPRWLAAGSGSALSLAVASMAATGEGSSSSLGSTKLALARPVDLELARRPLSPSPSTSTTMDPREYLRFLPPHPAPPIQLFAACSSSFRLLPGSDLTRSFLDLLPANRPRPCLDRSLLAANHVNKLRFVRISPPLASWVQKSISMPLAVAALLGAAGLEPSTSLSRVFLFISPPAVATFVSRRWS